MAELSIEITFALPESQFLTVVHVQAGSTVADVIAMSGVIDSFPEYDLAELTVGIWGRVVQSDQVVEEGDRVELYRPLKMDPRESRRMLAETGRTMSGKSTDDKAPH